MHTHSPNHPKISLSANTYSESEFPKFHSYRLNLLKDLEIVSQKNNSCSVRAKNRGPHSSRGQSSAKPPETEDNKTLHLKSLNNALRHCSPNKGFRCTDNAIKTPAGI